MCFSREGHQISFWQMVKLLNSRHYRRVLKDAFYCFKVSTTWFGYAVFYNNRPYIFKSEVYCNQCPPENNILDGDIFRTEVSAYAGHALFVEKWFRWKLLIRHIWFNHILKKYELERPKATKGKCKKVWSCFTW